MGAQGPEGGEPGGALHQKHVTFKKFQPTMDERTHGTSNKTSGTHRFDEMISSLMFTLCRLSPPKNADLWNP